MMLLILGAVVLLVELHRTKKGFCSRAAKGLAFFDTCIKLSTQIVRLVT